MMSDSGQASDVDNIKNISNNFVSRKYEYEKNQIDRSQSVTSKYHLLLFCAFIMISSVGAMVVYPIEFHENNIYFNLFAVICILSAASAVYENSCKYVVACLCGEDCIYAFQFINFSTSFSSSVSLILYILLPNWCFVTGLVVMIILGILSILCYRVLELSY
jgi:magnesium-transporting ATPase (P-type)